MEDFDIFTNEINFTQPLFKNILNKYVKEVPSTPNGLNYQSKFMSSYFCVKIVLYMNTNIISSSEIDCRS